METIITMLANTVINKEVTKVPGTEMEKTTQVRILKAAEKEFLEKGYFNASLRNISKEAGVTTGALYRYYDSKEALFAALVEEEAEYVLRLFTKTLDDFEKLPDEVQTESMTEISNDAIDRLLEYIYDHPDAFRLLLARAEGTRYGGFLERLVEREVESTYTYMETLARMGHPVEELDESLIHMIASGMFAGIFETVVHGMPKEQAKVYVSQLRRFHSAGWAELMKVDFFKRGIHC